MLQMVEEIAKLKRERGALILAHYYQPAPIQDIADFVGDSLDLARKAQASGAETIVFCGVYFMAETAKILSPKSEVLLPNLGAGCPMACMVSPEDVLRLRSQHPDAAVMCYVNSSAAVKAQSDICCTSSNAVRVARSLREEKIIFVPDRNLGHFVSLSVPEKRFVLFDGFCPTHDRISRADVVDARRLHPGAPVLVHPECPPDVVALSDFAGSTAQIIDYAMRSEHAEFVIGTESGILHRLKSVCPNKTFYMLSQRLVCPNMKKTTLPMVRDALAGMKNRIEVDPGISRGALASLERMLSIG